MQIPVVRTELEAAEEQDCLRYQCPTCDWQWFDGPNGGWARASTHKDGMTIQVCPLCEREKAGDLNEFTRD